jgi:hypothetical protein
LEKSLVFYGITSADFCNLVPDGASNCVAALKLLLNKVPSGVCDCHDLARAVLTALGMGAALSAADGAAVAEMTAALKMMRSLAIKFHTGSKLKDACHDSQAAAGVGRVLETIKAGITRWNGVYLGMLRNIQIKAHVVHALGLVDKLNIATFDDEGEVVTKETAASSMTPMDKQWRLAAEASVVALEPVWEATQLLQGFRTMPDMVWVLIKNLHAHLSAMEGLILKVPASPAPGSTTLLYIDRTYANLLPETKCVVKLLTEQVYNRFIANGPAKPSLIAILLNPTLNASKYLTYSQLASAKLHLRLAMDEAAVELDTGGGAWAGTGATWRPAEGAALPGAVSFDKNSVNLLAPDMISFSDDEDEDRCERDTEDTAWAAITKKDIRHGVVTIAGKEQFRILVFWADAAICRKFRLRARVVKGVFAAITHEATSESTFSGAGRAFSHQRTKIDPEQLCHQDFCVPGEKRRPSTSASIQPCYQDLKRRRTAASSSGAEAPEAPTTPAAVPPPALAV